MLSLLVAVDLQLWMCVVNVSDFCESVSVAFCCGVLFSWHVCTRIEFAFCNKEGMCNVHVLDNIRAHALYRILYTLYNKAVMICTAYVFVVHCWGSWLKYVCSYAVFNLIAHITINGCCYFVLLLVHVLASMVHFLGGYLQRNAFETNSIKDVHIWSSNTLLSIIMLLTL